MHPFRQLMKFMSVFCLYRSASMPRRDSSPYGAVPLLRVHAAVLYPSSISREPQSQHLQELWHQPQPQTLQDLRHTSTVSKNCADVFVDSWKLGDMLSPCPVKIWRSRLRTVWNTLCGSTWGYYFVTVGKTSCELTLIIMVMTLDDCGNWAMDRPFLKSYTCTKKITALKKYGNMDQLSSCISWVCRDWPTNSFFNYL